MSLTAWFSVFLICLLGAATPGPSLAIVMRNCVHRSRTHGLVASWCHALAIGLYALAAILGLGLVIQKYPTVFQGIMYLGAAYLVWLASKALRAGKSGFSLEKNGDPEPLTKAMVEGSTIVFLNPKIALFFTALFSQFIYPDMPWQVVAILVATVTIVDGCWYTLVSLVLSHHGLLPWLQRHGHWIDRITGVVFLLVAVRVVLQ
ncbi:LysE family translocator [Corallincola platygyrae]|uniref:LysE family translocator n=2 Tax=Corallincola platygyrae TaxID=1193278 RepID=A0ABW4XRW6_9GAMM